MRNLFVLRCAYAYDYSHDTRKDHHSAFNEEQKKVPGLHMIFEKVYDFIETCWTVHDVLVDVHRF